VAQRAITMLLEPIYEQDFLPCSFGFRAKRSAHQALQALCRGFMRMKLRWVLDVDMRKYFDTIDHRRLREFLDRRVTDGVVRKMIDKWLKAGVLEDGALTRATEGTPQGGVISPLLANIFLHYVLDEWFETAVRPRLKGGCMLIRYADDFVMAFDDYVDARRVFAVLGKRFGRYGLQLHPDKTRFVDFRFRRPGGANHPTTDGATFDYLGFTHIWGKSLRGRPVVRQLTAQGRFARAVAAVKDWCRTNRHLPIRVQHAHLSAMMRGHFAYYGITGNHRRISWYRHQVVRIWRKWLSRRGSSRCMRWASFEAFSRRNPLPPAKIAHQYAAASKTSA
jgi:group II intron reverse transcriptase/maturase